MKIKKLKGSSKPKGICKLAIEGDMTIYTAEELHSGLMGIVGDYKDFDISLAGVEDIDTTGVQILLALKRRAESESTMLSLKEPSDSIQEIANLFNVADRLDFVSA